MSTDVSAIVKSPALASIPPRVWTFADWGWDAMFPLPRRLDPPRSPYQDGRLGWRQYTYLDENGEKQFEEIGLTPEDLLDPWPGDKPVASWNHNRDIERIRGTVQSHLPHDWRGVRIPYDNKVLFEDENVEFNPSPDVAVLVNVPDDALVLNSFRIRSMGIRIAMIFEVVSPEDAKVRVNDLVIKKDIYEAAGVPLYIIVDVPEYRETSKRKLQKRGIHLIAYELGEDGRYREAPRDPQGRIFLAPLNLWMGKSPFVSPHVEQVAFFDPATGEELPDPSEFLKTARKEIRDAKEETEKAREQSKKAEEKAKAAEDKSKKAEEKAKAAEDALEELRRELDRIRAARNGANGPNGQPPASGPSAS